MSAAPPFLDVASHLARHAREASDEAAFEYLDEGHPGGARSSRTYAHLDARARAISAAVLSIARPGDRVLLLFPPGLEFVDAFFGCLYANLVPVPAYPPDPARLERTLPRLVRIAEDAAVSAVLTTSLVGMMKEALPDLPPVLAECPWLSVDEVETRSGDGVGPGPRSPGDLAFLHFGELALLEDKPRAATLEAREPAEVYTLAKEEFLAAIERSETLKEELLNSFYRRR